MSKANLIGILGGTFDPVHAGHLRIALELYEQGPFQEIRLIPCDTPVHRPAPLLDAQTRLALLQAATQDQPGMVVDDRELQRNTPSYMVETLRTLQAEQTESRLCLIMGVDAFNAFDSWHQWQSILTLAHLIVIDRPGYCLPTTGAIAELLAQHRAPDYAALQARPAGLILNQSPVYLDISSTHLRQCLSEQRSIRYLVPDSVWSALQK